MTESQWLSSQDIHRMIRYLGYEVNPADSPLMVTDRPRDVPLASAHQLRQWITACRRMAVPNGQLAAWWSDLQSDSGLQQAVYEWSLTHHASWRKAVPVATRCSILRCIAGNPFRPYHVRWSGGPLITLARAAVENLLPDGALDPVRLLVLADALEEAGCAASPPRTEAAMIYVQHHGDGWRVLAAGVEGPSSNYRARNRREAVRYAESTFRVRAWQAKEDPELRSDPGERPVWGKGLVTLPEVPNPVLAHLRGEGSHYPGCHALSCVLPEGEDA